MNISFDWLKQYVDIEGMTPQELDDLLTFSGLEVDSKEKVETIKGGLEHVVIAQVLTCEPHPDSDHLHLTTVDVGTGTPLNIVCGAPNVAAGQKVVCAQIGTKIYTSDTEYYEIKKGKLRGAVSEGMLCAADELQLGTDHAGIMVLPDDAPVGMPAKEYFHVQDDWLFEVANGKNPAGTYTIGYGACASAAGPKFFTLEVSVDGQVVGQHDLADDPADHRGILSWGAQTKERWMREGGSYGELVRMDVPVKALGKDKVAVIRFTTPADDLDGGLALYGKDFGRYPLDPTLVLKY